MKTLTVEKVYTKEFEGKNGKFKKYSVKSGGVWYTIMGLGKDSVKENDTIMGECSQRTYQTKEGKEGVENIIKLVDPIIADILERLENLEGLITQKKAEPENNEDLPF